MKTIEEFIQQKFNQNERDYIQIRIDGLIDLLDEYASQFQVKAEGVSDEVFGYVNGSDFYKFDSPSLSADMRAVSTPVIKAINKQCVEIGEYKEFSDEYIKTKANKYDKEKLGACNQIPAYTQGFKDCRDRMLSLLAEKDEKIKELTSSLFCSERFRMEDGASHNDEKLQDWEKIKSLQSELEAVKRENERLFANYLQETQISQQALNDLTELKSQAEKDCIEFTEWCSLNFQKLSDKLGDGNLWMDTSLGMGNKKQTTQQLYSHYKLTVPTDIKK